MYIFDFFDKLFSTDDIRTCGFGLSGRFPLC